jgi:dipeptidyl aminopeptidase/acylaminoacyl peptidase
MKIKHSFFLSLAFAFFSLFATAAENLSPEKLLNLCRIDGASISPDGKSMLYQVTTPDVSGNSSGKEIFSCALGGGEPTRWGNFKEKVMMPTFIANGKKVAFTKVVSGNLQVFVSEPDGSAPKQLTNAPNGINTYVFSADAGRMVYTSQVKTGKNINEIYPDLDKVSGRIIDDLDYRNWDSWDDYTNSHVFVCELKDFSITATREWFAGETYDYDGIAISPDGSLMACWAKKLNGKAAAVSTNTDVFLCDLTTGSISNITEWNKGYDKDPVFSPNSKMLAYTSMAEDGYESDKAVLHVYEVRTGKDRILTGSFAEGVSSPCWNNESSGLYFIAPFEGTEQVYQVMLKDNSIKAITRDVADYTSVQVTGDKLLLGKMSMSYPRTYVLWDLPTGKEREITSNNRALLSTIQMGKVEKNWVKTSDGKKELVWLIFPPDFNPAQKYPALLYCQGGPQSQVSQFFSFRWNFQLMASQGYIVVAPNRRGLPGFGKEWNDAIARDWGGQAISDYYAAIDSMSKRPYVDASRLGAVGASYGGYSVYYMAGNHKKRFRSFIAHCGLFNLESWYTSTDEHFFSRHDIGKGYWEKEGSEAIAKHSPHRMVGNWDTPILVIHDELDFRVPVSEGMQAFGAARLRDLRARFLYIPDEGHWVMKPQNALLWHREFFRWLRETL